MRRAAKAPEDPAPKGGAAKRLRPLLRLVFGGIAAVFVVVALRDLWTRWDPSSVRVAPLWVLASVPFCVAASALQASAWLGLIDSWGRARVPRPPAFHVYFTGQLARYTPGKVGLPAVRIAGARSLGVSPSLMGSTLLVEVLAWLVSGSVIGTLTLLAYPEAWSELGRGLEVVIWLALAGALGATALLAVIDRRRLPAAVLRALRVEGSGPLVPLGTLGWFALHWLSWIAHGALLGVALGASPGDAALVGAVLALSIVVGFLALLAPAGAGVREAFVVVGAAPVLGVTGAVTVGLFARGISILVELALWFGARQFARRAEADADAP